MKNNLNIVKVIFEDPMYNYFTHVSHNSTEEGCGSYFIGKYFDVGIYPKENMQKCIDIKFTNNNK